jgi:hypothetical protein
MFLDMEMNEALERRAPLPVGDYTGVIGDVKARAWSSQKDTSKSGIAWDVPIVLDVPAELQTELGLPPTLNVKDSIMLDLTEAGGLDMGKGKNGRLRTYREALDMNKPGESFSARKMTGGIVRVKISHELYQDNIMERVAGVAKA